MKNKKIKLSILLSLIFVFVSLCFSNTVKAVGANEELYLGIQEYRQTSDPENMGYAIKNPDDNGTSEETMVGANIWKIVQYNSSSEQDNVYNTDTTFYCVKAGVGFSKTSTRQTYKKSYDFIKDKKEINSTNNTVLQSIVTTDNYYGIIALADLMYIPESSSEQDKENLIKNMFAENGITEENIDKAYPVKLTDEDIDAVQQAALWYYTNYDSVAYEKVYNQYNKDLWFMYKTDKEKDYHSLSDYNPSGTLAGEQREEQAKMLYNYLITKANENIPAYKSGEKVSKNKITLYTDGVVYTQPTKGICQPVIKIEKKKEFDLALRKYITKVDGKNVDISRNPVIDTTKLSNKTETTAIYKHKKDPVKVKYNDVVTYNITVYNEGEIDGRATKIVDQLPTGLKFSKVNTAGYTAQYDEETNRVVITKSGNTNIKAYDGVTLSSETIEIECIVETLNSAILTNVAWISEEVKEDGTVINNQVGEDRDSEPVTTPNVNKDSMQDYKGITTETDLSQNIFYPGQQDDDDFEKLVVEAVTGNYKLQLEKVDKDNPSVKLEGAEFEITLPGKGAETKTTGSNGLVDLGIVEITDINQKDEILVKETKAPTGYNKILDTMKIEVEKQLVDGAYTIKGATITEGEVAGTSVSVEGNVIKIVVANELIAGNYKLQLEKVDKDDPNVKLEGAEFEVTLPGKGAETKTTGSNGLVDLGTVEITDINQKDEILVKETKAPTGYNKILDTMKIEVEKQLVDGVYTIKGATITEGEVAGTSVSVEGNVIKIVVANELIAGNYKLQLEKVDKDDPNVKLEGAEFEVTLPGKGAETKTTGSNGLVDLGTVEITDINQKDEILVKETKAPTGYNKILDTMKIEVEKQLVDGVYTIKGATITEGEVAGTSVSVEGNVIKIVVANELIAGNYKLQLEKVDKDNPNVKLEGAEFEVTLPGKGAETKTTGSNGLVDLGTVEITDINQKDEILVKETKAPTGYNKILDTMEIEVEKQLVDGVYTIKGATITEGEVAGTSVSVEGNVIKIVVANELIAGNYKLQLEKVDKDNPNVKLEGAEFEITLPGKGAETKTTGANGLIDIGTVEITDVNKTDEIIVKETKAPTGYNKILDTMKIEVEKQLVDGTYTIKGATITEGKVEGTNITIENGIIKIQVANIKQTFDLSLRKFISKVNEIEYDRQPNVDITNLVNGSDTTAVYNHPKQEVSVDINDIVVYTIRIYNEGERDGYANLVTDYLPQGVEFIKDNEINKKYEWVLGEDGRTVTTEYLSKSKETETRQNLIKAFDGQTLDYKDIQIACKIGKDALKNVKLTNIAEITNEVDEEGQDVTDRDSQDGNVEIPNDDELPKYKDDETGEYVPGQEDDDDFEKVIIKPFDLALRKFITQVEKEEVTSRIPQVKYDSENNKITYEHSKEPVDVVTGNRVIYTIRVYNEGARDGYASEISDDIPAGLEFLPEDEINTEYRWVMYDKDGNETQEVENAVKITTDYLSKEQGEARMEEDSTIEENPALLKAFNPEEEISETNPDYADVKVAFKVTEPNTSDKIVINSAQISEDTDKDGDPVDDDDSTPDEWNDGEDDQDREYIKLNYFDLSLRKWVTQAIVIENGKETVTQTGHTPEQDPEPIVKVDLDRKKLSQVTVKFRFSIRVTNEGDIAGYAKEIKDYIPEGLRFVAEDNPGWTDLGNNVVSTDLLSDRLLQPGESADVEILLTWINSEDNMGLKTNTAEISKDYNEKGVPDIDSTPDNKKEGEDDIDDAPVMLSVKTGQAKVYYTLGLIVLVTIAGGIVLIKKFVL